VPPIFGRAAITLAIGPRSSFYCPCHEMINVHSRRLRCGAVRHVASFSPQYAASCRVRNIPYVYRTQDNALRHAVPHRTAAGVNEPKDLSVWSLTPRKLATASADDRVNRQKIGVTGEGRRRRALHGRRQARGVVTRDESVRRSFGRGRVSTEDASDLGVALHVQRVHLVEYERDRVLADDAEVRAHRRQLLVLQLDATAQLFVLARQLVTCLSIKHNTGVATRGPLQASQA